MIGFIVLAGLIGGLAIGGLTRQRWSRGAAPAERPSARLVAALALFVLGSAAAGYVLIGAPQQLDSHSAGPASAALPAGVEPQIAALAERIAERVSAHPDDANAWQMLARAHTALGKPAEAAAAWRRASQLRPGDATLLGELAFALALANQRSFAGEPAELIARALAIAPDNPKVLALAGTLAMDRKDYRGALGHWERLAGIEPPASPLARQIQASIVHARELAGMPTSRPVAR